MLVLSVPEMTWTVVEELPASVVGLYTRTWVGALPVIDQPADAGLMLSLVRALAAYEKQPGEVVATEADFVRDGFGPRPRLSASGSRKREASQVRLMM